MRVPRRDDDGFAMVFVLMVISMVTVAVAGVLTVTTPDISRTRQDQDGTGAGAAARAAVDDFIAYVSGIDTCRSTTRVCAQAKGAASGTKVLDPTSGATISWTTDSALTPEGYVRVHATGRYGRATRTLDADIALAPSILSYGYYSDYESQSSDALNSIYRAHKVRLDTSGTWQYASASAASTVTWATPANTATCDRHWWQDPSTSPVTPGRPASNAFTVGYSVDTTGRSSSFSGGCDIIFATGMTLNGPVYTRDAVFVDGTGGSGPLFQAPVITGWGYAGRTTPAYPKINNVSVPWRNQNNGTLSASPYKPKKADFDLQLPQGIGTEGLSANACVYTGPTRVKLNGNGTATITSPRTTTKAAGADPACYPSVVGTGITAWPIAYGTVGGGTILVRNIGTEPTAGWPTTGQKSSTTPSASTSTFWNTATAGTASNGTSAATDTCSASPYYSAAVNAACAWSEVPAATSTTGGWTTYTSGGACGSVQPADQKLFECEYSAKVGGTQTYSTFRTATRNALAGSTCATATSTTASRQQCLVDLLKAQLPSDTTARRYVVTPSTGTAVAGTTRAMTVTPAYPMAGDPLFANGPAGPGTESGTLTPVTLTVTRQASTNGGGTWSAAVPQFTVTVTSTTWAVATPASATSYFPSVSDVTQYAGSTGSSVAGDLYVEGTNKGKLSLLADNDVVVTNNLVNTSDTITNDAVNIVAGQYVRNFHPVSCVSTNSTSLAATDAGFCPNDVTGLGTPGGGSNGNFGSNHPASQYTNLQATGSRTIQAAVFALNGSLTSDNYNRGAWMGNLLIKGGVYQGHRGVNGTQLANNDGTVARSGYLLSYNYVDLRQSNLPYEPTTRVKSGRVWSVVSVSGNGAS
ncbi:hypothetical protein ACXR2U_15835 [Jatrophihabitans sp. YIM 134969]